MGIKNSNKTSHFASADLFIQKIISKKVEAYTSLFTWYEFVWILRKTLEEITAIEKGKNFLIFPNLILDSIS